MYLSIICISPALNTNIRNNVKARYFTIRWIFFFDAFNLNEIVFDIENIPKIIVTYKIKLKSKVKFGNNRLFIIL